MRLGTLTLAVLGLLLLSATSAMAQTCSDNVQTTPYVTTGTDQLAVTPVQYYGYRPGWRGYGYQPYNTYRPYYYSYPAPQYNNYYVDPNSGYYYSYPNSYGTQYYYGPRRAWRYGY